MPQAWEEFVATSSRLVLGAALRVLGHEADAEDVAQEVFVEIFRSDRRDEFARQPALLTTLATRRALDHLRRRRRTTTPLDAASDASVRGATPIEQAVADELLERLRREVVSLPPREAEVFCLVAFEQMEQPEVARHLNISVGAVAKALCKARQTLSRTLSAANSRNNS